MNYNIYKYLYILVFVLVSAVVGYAQSVNAGGEAIICGTEYTLKGSTQDSDASGLTWTVFNKPSGATDPVFSDPNILTPLVTGMNKPGVYTFRLTKVINSTTSVYSDVQIKSTGDTSSFTAGSDVLTIPATIGTVNLNGVIPEGFTGEWRVLNIFEYERFGYENSNNAQLSATNIANPTFSLIKKADHDVDPAYRIYLKIRSLYNPNCTFEKSIIVRFIPNPKVIFPEKSEVCVSSMDAINYYNPLATSPFFDTYQPNAAGNPIFGTTIVLNTISTPVGGSIQYLDFATRRIEFKTTALGEYKFTLTIKNSTGEYTTPILTYIKKGVQPSPISFLDSNHPEQYMVYAGSGSGGELLCNMEGSLTPVNINYSIDSIDDPTTITVSAKVQSMPGEEKPTIETFGEGLAKRYFKVTPPVGGWRIGTYVISINSRNGECSRNTNYYIHVSDGNRPDLKIEDVVVCYPGSGVVDAIVPLPPAFQEVIDPTYMKGYSGKYEISLVSKPAGSATPTYDSYLTTRSLKSNQTVIHNLDRAGEYVFKVKIEGYIDDVDWLVKQEYACSGASRETIFKVIVSEQVGANAGSNQDNLYCRARTVLVGNDPGAGQGKWTVESAPVGMSPTFSDDSNPKTIIAGMDATGGYKFRWTITTGDCISSSIVEVITDQDNCKKPLIITNPTTTSKTIKRRK
ncbi:hypothetical protein HX049_18060 [Myroides odoratimimus]|uniref:hypothetical protein n=1 Tax=Myroides odoratimimus TaxID=76832 RepID=UPI0025791498|nr:hypothetical protein [Myroides odoratimimus]MDM1399035.1 hypothetical protein [Myroides odoratimimus]